MIQRSKMPIMVARMLKLMLQYLNGIRSVQEELEIRDYVLFT